MHCSGVSVSAQVLIYCLGVDVMISVVYAMFWFWVNVRVFMQCSGGVDAMFGCWCIVRLFMQCSGFIAVFGCQCIAWLLMQCSVVDAIIAFDALHKLVKISQFTKYNSYCSFNIILRFLQVFWVQHDKLRGEGETSFYSQWDCLWEHHTVQSCSNCF